MKACLCPACLDAYEHDHPGTTTRTAAHPAPFSLTTPRLWMREFTEADAPFMRELATSPTFLSGIGDHGVRTDADAAAYLRNRYIASYRQHGFGMWRLARRSDDTPVGLCGLAQRDCLEAPDIGFAIAEAHLRQGYAHESAGEVLRYARDTLRLPRLHGVTTRQNTAAGSLLEQLGLRCDGTITSSETGRELLVFTVVFRPE